VAMGSGCNAGGNGAVSLGTGNTVTNGGAALGSGNNTATGYVFGQSDTSSGMYATAIGYSCNAAGGFSLAMGYGSKTTGSSAIGFGNNCNATGNECIAIGNSSSATFNSDFAIGNNVIASGGNSTALGNYASTNGQQGAVVIGDLSVLTLIKATALNTFNSRFAGGYNLYSNGALTAGVTLSSGAGSWTSVSDRRKKENLVAINTEDILQKIGAMPLTRWNYKAQPKEQQHVGPMAQDFWAAFHLDGQSDTTINSLDIDGINMAGIQALKNRTDEQQKIISEQQKAIDDLKKQNEQLKVENQATQTTNQQMLDMVKTMKAQVDAINEKLNITTQK
jgi:hypothetical protein